MLLDDADQTGYRHEKLAGFRHLRRRPVLVLQVHGQELDRAGQGDRARLVLGLGRPAAAPVVADLGQRVGVPGLVQRERHLAALAGLAVLGLGPNAVLQLPHDRPRAVAGVLVLGEGLLPRPDLPARDAAREDVGHDARNDPVGADERGARLIQPLEHRRVLDADDLGGGGLRRLRGLVCIACHCVTSLRVTA